MKTQTKVKFDNEHDFDEQLNELYNSIDNQNIDMNKVGVKVKILNIKLAKEKTKIQLQVMSGTKPNSWFFDPVGYIGNASEIKQNQISK
ncbi:MAG TPA: hypothetical protein VFF57_12105 [Hanamia sp.]|nr:hypothetical protein [Hanamia sp.]